MTEASWIAARTKPKCEFIAKMYLEQQGYGVYLPLCTEGGETMASPMFPNYVFVELNTRSGQWRPISNTRGVQQVLMTGEHPSRMPTRVVDLLQSREEAGIIRLRRRIEADKLQPGQIVKVHEGPFMGFEGVFERHSGTERVMIMLNMFGGSALTEVATDKISAVA